MRRSGDAYQDFQSVIQTHQLQLVVVLLIRKMDIILYIFYYILYIFIG